MNPFFSIIIPAYNVEKYIARAIKSVLSQSFQDYEIIIVNDGSVDKTSVIIDGYAKENKKIKIINHLKNESLHIVRMDGVAESNGKYIMFLDSDDYFTKNALDILYSKIQINNNYDFYEFAYIQKPSGKKIFPSFKGEDRFSAYFSVDNCPPPTMWNKVYDAEFIKKVFSSSLERVYINNIEDTYESIIISWYTKKVFYIKEIIINYSIGTGISTTNKNYTKIIDYVVSLNTVLNLVNKFIKDNKLFINIEYLYIRHLSYVIYFINSQKDNEEKKKLFLVLLDYFDSKIILKCFLNSKDYIIGHKITQLLRRIRKLIKI